MLYMFYVFLSTTLAADLQSEGGMHLALALWSRSGVLLELKSGAAALSDLQYSLECGLPSKQHSAYYLRLARANASELKYWTRKTNVHK